MSRFSFNIAASDTSPSFDRLLSSALASEAALHLTTFVRGSLVPRWPAFAIACPQLRRNSVLIQLCHASQGNFSRRSIFRLSYHPTWLAISSWTTFQFRCRSSGVRGVLVFFL